MPLLQATEKALIQVRDWAAPRHLSDTALVVLVRDTLAAAGCRNPGDTTLYIGYLGMLLDGRQDVGPLKWLSLSAMQQAAAVLLAWRNWLTLGEVAPAFLDSLVLDCLAVIQSLAAPRLAARQENCDHVTGLPDHTALPQALVLARQHTIEGRSTALLYVEITSNPHAYPDELLQEVGRRLSKLLRNHDTLFFLDRQTFSLLLVNLSGEGHALLAANRVLSCFEAPFLQEEGDSILLHPRIGIVFTPEHGETAEQLLSAGATAAHEYSADSVGVYDPKRDKLNYALKRLEIPLRHALQENRLHMVFQPQISCRDHAFFGMESLLRWQDETLGPVRTDEMVMVAEHLGLMGTLTHWVLNASLREYSKLLRTGIPGSISINLSPANLRDRELPAAIQDALSVWQVPAHRVVLEITESALIENLDSALESLRTLKRLGCRLALDDFGTGYSSLSYLKLLPIDELKIDRSFIVTMHESGKDAGIVRTIIELAHLLGMVVVTEGVEDAETVQMLQAMGNDVIQGYFYSKPLLPSAVPAFLASLK